jgi:hypothetical protein
MDPDQTMDASISKHEKHLDFNYFVTSFLNDLLSKDPDPSQNDTDQEDTNLHTEKKINIDIDTLRLQAAMSVCCSADSTLNRLISAS